MSGSTSSLSTSGAAEAPPTRSARRLLLGVGAIVTLAEAAALLPLHDRDARAWLRERGLVRNLFGRSVVAWIDVIEAIRAPEPERGHPPRPAAPQGRTKL